MPTRWRPPARGWSISGTTTAARAPGCAGWKAWEIETALSPSVVAVAFSANAASLADLPTVAAVCRANGVPLIVDAAAQLPPKENLRRFIAMGADLVAFSGGKALGGPQASGILAGRRDLVASALLQQLDMDVAPETWTPPRLVDRANLRGVPHHGIGRGFKAGKEEIVGLLTALDRFVKADDAADNAALEARLKDDRREAGWHRRSPWCRRRRPAACPCSRSPSPMRSR